MSGQGSSQSHTPETSDPIAGFPTSGQPVSDTVLKDMLMSLRSSIHHDMLHTVNKCQAEVHIIGERVNQIEHAMGEHATLFNKMEDAHTAHSDDIKDKIADLEDPGGIT